MTADARTTSNSRRWKVVADRTREPYPFSIVPRVVGVFLLVVGCVGCGGSGSPSPSDVGPKLLAEPPPPASTRCAGTIGFSAFQTVTLGTSTDSRGARWLELNGDSLLDVVGVYGAGVAVTRLGVPGGGFAGETMYPQVVPPLPTTGELSGAEDLSQTLVTDVDNDGRQDVLLLSHGVQTLRNTGDGTFAVGSMSTNVSGTKLVVGDFDGDGIRDLVIPGRGSRLGGPVPMPDVHLLHGLGDGQFTDMGAIWGGGVGIIAAAAIDIDSDGKLDVVVDRDTREVLIGHGDGTFEAPRTQSSIVFGASPITAQDLDGDGRSDLFTAHGVGINNGDGTLTMKPISEPTIGTQPAFADFDGDGAVDIVTRANAGVAVLLGHGDGTFAAPEFFAANGYWNGAVSTGDADGDGVVDILVESPTNEANVLYGRCL